MNTLLDISDELLRLVEQLEQAIEDENIQNELIHKWFEQLVTTEQARNDKLDSYAALIQELDARVKVRKAEAQRLQQRARVDDQLAQFLKANLRKFFERHQLKIVETNRFRLTLARNGGRAPVQLSIPPEELPTQYQNITIKANLEAIRDAISQGETISGASLGERGSRIRIG